jgi:two-component system response regulator YesN
MPDLMGIDFMRKVLATDSSVVFAFVSGYADFSYAQQALRQGAFDYLLKPVSPEDAKAFVLRLAEHLNQQALSKDISVYTDLLARKLTLDDLFPGSGAEGGRLQAFFVQMQGNAEPFSLGERAKSRRLYLGLGKYLYLAVTRDSLSDFLRSQAQRPQVLRIGVSLPAQLSCSPEAAVGQAERAFMQAEFSAGSPFCQYRKADPDSIRSLLNELIDGIHRKDFAKCRGLLSESVKNGLQIEDAILVWNQLLLYAKDSSQEFLNFSRMNLQDSGLTFRNYDEMWDALIDILQSDREKVEDCACSNQVYRQMLSYLEKHYTEDLHLKELSDRFFINFTYACELFKKYSGTTFSKYLTRLRMERSVELLRSGNLSIEEICYQAGYNNYSYFSKVFKKCYDMTPYQYRQLHRNQEFGEESPAAKNEDSL